ncbi:TIGR02444 family protein [Salipiger abyssi]|uniref:TIGR02444 family protein n=1 Tax=Salipiger abyssi TaxID=1250539 RepID=UPI001A8D1814|nr:TIGR02444 family protein [Salipiger abyssi]MBN9887854.1 TIGR02444 family protein [Salipiger abyssi]
MPIQPDPDAHPFWRFSLDRYGRSGVPPLCLEIQEETGADVNLLLFGLWLGSEGWCITGAGAGRCAEAVAAWHAEIVRPLRAVRRRLKGWQVCPDAPRETLRAGIQKWEIEAERLEQDMLFALYEGLLVAEPALIEAEPDRAAAMTANLDTFAALAPKGKGAAEPRDKLVALCL